MAASWDSLIQEFVYCRQEGQYNKTIQLNRSSQQRGSFQTRTETFLGKYDLIPITNPIGHRKVR